MVPKPQECVEDSRQAARLMSLPDPIISANIYCSGCLDEVITGAIVPFWKRVNQERPNLALRLWLMRYGKCGEHVKVRMHAPALQAPSLKIHLEEAIAECFSGLGESTGKKPIIRKAQPIDVEDRATADYTDRTLLWTQYQRNVIALGSEIFLEDDRYCDLFTECLACGTEILLLALADIPPVGWPSELRQKILLEILNHALGGLRFTSAKRLEYHKYHRDWLFRFSLVRVSRDVDPMDEQVTIFDRSCQDEPTPDQSPESSRETDRWKNSLRKFYAYLSPICQKLDNPLDPYATYLEFTALFKVFHGIANQIGLSALDEAFVHHILLRLSEFDADSSSADDGART